jgi:hypothetical protein
MIIFDHHDHLRAPVSFLGRPGSPESERLWAASRNVAANHINETLPAAMIVRFGHNAPE